MNFPVAAIQASEAAALVGPVTIYGVLIASSLRERADGHGGTSLLVSSLFGVSLCIAALASGLSLLRYLALTFFALVVIAILVPVLAEALREKQWRWPEAAIRLWERPKVILFGLGLALVAAGGAALGAVVLGDGSTITTTSVSPSGRYRITGTCVNGSCYVNECRTPAKCGSGNKGELKEETAVDIVCQIDGEVTKAPNGLPSDVWDRLSTNLYVSDLFVEGTRHGHFAQWVPRCSGS